MRYRRSQCADRSGSGGTGLLFDEFALIHKGFESTSRRGMTVRVMILSLSPHSPRAGNG